MPSLRPTLQRTAIIRTALLTLIVSVAIWPACFVWPACSAEVTFPATRHAHGLLTGHAAEPLALVQTDAPPASPPGNSDPESAPVRGTRNLWFVASCLLLPVLWGGLVHQLFSRLRKKQRPDRSRETGWPDYQI